MMKDKKKEVKEEEVIDHSTDNQEELVEEISDQGVISSLTKENEKLIEELKEVKNDYLKAYADTENMKRRLQNEADTMKKYRLQSFAAEILPILDSFERALMVPSDDGSIQNYVQGFEMIYKQLLNILQQEGIHEIEALHKPFDPNFHQALMQEQVEGVESGMVVEVLQKGYVLKDRVIRATLVKVSE